MKLHQKQSRENNSVCKQELSFLYGTYCHDLFYLTVECRDNIPNGIKVTDLKKNCI